MNEKISSAVDGLNLPYSAEAEQAVLGAILIDPEKMSEVMEILPSPDYFYLSSHKVIYKVMIDLFTLNIPIDLITILDKLRMQKDYNEADSKTYLMSLATIVQAISNIQDYAKIVKKDYMRRMLVLTSREIIEDAVNYEEDEIGELIDSAEQRILDIRDTGGKREMEAVGQSIVKTFTRLDELNSAESEKYKAIPTGIGLLDATITGLNRSDLIILAARPGMGKTSFALNIARNVAVKSRKRVAFFSLEMTKEQLASRLLSTEGMIQGTKLRTGKLDDDEWIRLIEAADVLSKTDMYFDDTPGININEMKAKLRRLKTVDLVIVDYLQLMSSTRRIDNRVQEISEITRNLKILAKELGVPVITLSQLSRDSEKRTEHKPQLSDLRDSGSIEQDADIVLFLYRDDYYKDQENKEDVNKNSGECIVAKNRHGETRSVPLYWQGEIMRFTSQELTRGE